MQVCERYLLFLASSELSHSHQSDEMISAGALVEAISNEKTWVNVQPV